MINKHFVLMADFCLHHQVEASFIVALNDFDLIKINESKYLLIEDLGKIEKMARLHDELGINIAGIHAVAHLLEQMECLQQELSVAKNQLMVFMPNQD